jgi:hypothetical protein
MKLELDFRDSLMVKFNKLQTHILEKWPTAEDLVLLDLGGACTAPGVSSYSIPAEVPLPQMPVVVHLPAFPNQETLSPGQARDGVHIAKVQNTIDTKMDNKMMDFEAGTFQLSSE